MIQDRRGWKSEIAKLAELRARTDRQLLEIIDNKLGLGLTLAATASNHHAGNPEFAQQLRMKAQQAQAEALKLLPVVYVMSEADRRRLETKLAQLGAALGNVPLPHSVYETHIGLMRNAL